MGSTSRFIVELQKAKQNFFKNKSIFYASFPIQEQALKGEWNFELAPVYSIGILDFVFDDHKNEETVVHTVKLKNQNGDTFYDKLTFIYIELPKFEKSLDQLETHQDKWLYLFRYLPTIEGQPQPFQGPVFLQLFTVAEIANFTPDEQTSYQNSLKYYRDLNNVIDTPRAEGKIEGRAEGKIEGRAEGKIEGRAEEKLEIARALSGKVPMSTLNEATGLTIDELNQMAEPEQ